jgi:hypothetical protein
LLNRSGEAEGHESGSNEHSGLHDCGGVPGSDFACEDGGGVIKAVFAGSSLGVSVPSLYLAAPPGGFDKLNDLFAHVYTWRLLLSFLEVFVRRFMLRS